jgi:hypothetical protein
MNWGAIEAIGTWATALVALGGIFFVRRQLQQFEPTIWGDTHERLTTESFEILKVLASKPESYPYFYEGKKLETGSQQRVFILCAAEMLANYLEHVINQRPNMSAADWKVWNRFLTDTLKMGPVVCDLLRERKGWYSEELVQFCEQVERQLTSGSVGQNKSSPPYVV